MPPVINQVIPITDYSDGNASKWPGHDSTVSALDTSRVERFRTSVGNRWMSDRNESKPGFSYAIERLPTGYRLYGRFCEDMKHLDSYVYGHPSGYAFRSVPEFYDHFVSLQKNGSSSCQCKGCVRPSGHSSLGRTATAQPTMGVRQISPPPQPVQAPAERQVFPSPPTFRAPKQDFSEMVDEEGTSDIYRRLVAELKEAGSKGLSKSIEEPDSIDWCIENETLPQHLEQLRKQPRWLPRKGELVIFVRKLHDYQTISLDETDGIFRIWDQQSMSWSTHRPSWEAGVVAEACVEPATLEDLISDEGKEFPVNYSGFRVEPMPRIGQDDKLWSKRSTYLPLRQIRPFVFSEQFLHKTTDVHQTISNAIGAASSFSLLKKYHFKGVYPAATIFCKGIYLGAELLVVGDAVRLMPAPGDEDQTHVKDVMKITAIKLKFLDIDSVEESDDSDDDDDRQALPWFSCVHMSGIVYTTDARKAHGLSKTPIDAQSGELPQGLDGYGSWFYSHEPSQRMQMPFQRVLGRCYEDEAMMLWFPQSARELPPVASFIPINSKGKGKEKATETDTVRADLSLGLQGAMASREQGAAQDPRIIRRVGKTWFWGENRVQQLDLHEFKNVDVGSHTQFGGEISISPRQAKHLDAMRRAKRAREKGHRGPGRPAGSGKSREMKGLTQKFAASALVAGGLNAVQTQSDEDEEDSDNNDDGNSDDMQDVVFGSTEADYAARKDAQRGTHKFRDLDAVFGATTGAHEQSEDDLVADQLVEEMAREGGRAGAEYGEAARKRQRVVVELDSD